MMKGREESGSDNVLAQGVPASKDLIGRLNELVCVHGRKWSVIARIAAEEGYRDQGRQLSANALRKRFARSNERPLPRRIERTPPEAEPAARQEPTYRELMRRNRDLSRQLKEATREADRLREQAENTARETTSPAATCNDHQPFTANDMIDLFRRIGEDSSTVPDETGTVADESHRPTAAEMLVQTVRESLIQRIQGIVDRQLTVALHESSVTTAVSNQGEGGFHTRAEPTIPQDRFARRETSGLAPVLPQMNVGVHLGVQEEIKSLQELFVTHFAHTVELSLRMMNHTSWLMCGLISLNTMLTTGPFFLKAAESCWQLSTRYPDYHKR
ncbi:MAG: hypothetical protein HY914_19935 [Desulfomonile tiedjei]|nr:hypothetical protein [Desulfomonile tiedjei]